MKYIVIIFFMLNSIYGFSQKDSSNYYISNLSWNSFTITTNYVTRLILKEDAKRIIAIANKDDFKKLIDCLNYKNKSVVAHVLLTQIFEPKAAKFSWLYTYSQDSTIRYIEYTYNDLKWTWNKNQGFQIKKSDMKRIKKYWVEKYIKLEVHI